MLHLQTTIPQLLRDLCCLTLLALAVIGLNLGALTGSERIAAYHDNLLEGHPLRVEAARQWKEGRVPLWNPYKRAGAPLLADTGSGALYPGNLPFLFSHGGPRYRSLELVAVLHYVLAALFMYFFLRTIDVGRAAALLGALVFSGNGALLWTTSWWIQMQGTWVWLPLILAAVHRAAEDEAFWGWIAVGAVAVALQVFAGYPEYSVYSCLIACLYPASLNSSTRRRRAFLAVAAIYTAGAGVAAVQLLPSLELAADGIRGWQVSLKEFLKLPVTPGAILGSVVPGLRVSMPYPLSSTGTCYFGALAVVFAVEGARSLERHRVFFTSVLVIGCLLALGPFSPVAALAYKVPGLNAFRYGFKHLFEITFAVSVLTALGTDSFVTKQRGARAAVLLVTAAALSLLLYLSPTVRGSESQAHASLQNYSTHTLIVIAGMLAFVAVASLGRRRLALGVALLILWLGYAANRADVFDPRGWRPVNNGLVRPKIAHILRNPGRIFSPLSLSQESGLSHSLAGDYATEFRVHAVHGAGPYLWAPLSQALAMSANGVLHSPVPLRAQDQVLDVLACRYVLAPRLKVKHTFLGGGKILYGGLLRRGGYRTIAEDKSWLVVERPRPLPQVRFVDEVVCSNGVVTAQLIHSSKHDFGRIALVNCRGKPAPPTRLVPSQSGQVTVLRQEPGYWMLRTQLPALSVGFLVVSQSDMPGWHATIDGKQTEIYRAYGLVQGLAVSGGEHMVEFKYWPRSFHLGLLFSAATACTLSTLVLWEALRRRRRRQPQTISN